MNKVPSEIRADILKEAGSIEEITGSFSFEAFANDSMQQRAACMTLVILYQLVEKLSSVGVDIVSPQELREMAGMRNRIVHDYHAITLLTVWETMLYDVPKLRRLVE